MAIDSSTWRIAHLHICAYVVRENDRARLGMETAVVCTKSDSIELATNVEMRCGELLHLECCNLLQRFRKRIEGTVVEVHSSTQEGVWIANIEPRLRFTPTEVRLLQPRQPPFAMSAD